MAGDPVPYPADEDEVIAASRATGNRYPAMRHMTPELAPEGTGPRHPVVIRCRSNGPMNLE